MAQRYQFGRGDKKIAIIGSGIAGLSAAWLLNEKHDVTIFEDNDYVGGHSNTVDIALDDRTIPVDTGFIVYNPTNYPNLTALFNQLSVPTVSTDMSFSVSLDDGAFEYAGGDGGGLLAQRANLLRPRFWSMIAGVLKFYRNTQRYIDSAQYQGFTLRDLLVAEGYSSAFVKDHLAPMGAAIWSSNSHDILDYPALSFLKFFHNHGLTQLSNRPQWRTVVGGSREYVRRIMAPFADKIILNTPIEHVGTPEDGLGGVLVTPRGMAPQRYDEVIFACHSDQALALVNEASPEHASMLRDLEYSANKMAVHTDVKLMPKRKRAWASWNYVERTNAKTDKPAISYWMNQLQHLPTDTPVIATLNPDRLIDAEKVLCQFDYAHPVMDQKGARAKRRLWPVQGQNHMWFAGAYLGDGFHEDGIQAGLAVAEMLSGERRPWHIHNQNARIGLSDDVGQGLGKAA